MWVIKVPCPVPEVPFAKEQSRVGSDSKHVVFMSASPSWGLK